MINPWRILGVHRTSSIEEIQKRYKEQARKTHPDAGGLPGQFELTKQAFDLLYKRQQRNAYLKKLSVFGKRCVPCDGLGQVYKTKGFTTVTSVQQCQDCGGSGFIFKEDSYEQT